MHPSCRVGGRWREVAIFRGEAHDRTPAAFPHPSSHRFQCLQVMLENPFGTAGVSCAALSANGDRVARKGSRLEGRARRNVPQGVRKLSPKSGGKPPSAKANGL